VLSATFTSIEEMKVEDIPILTKKVSFLDPLPSYSESVFFLVSELYVEAVRNLGLLHQLKLVVTLGEPVFNGKYPVGYLNLIRG
jgi:hypothetical protein